MQGVAHAGCEKDTDCKGDRICEAGACVNPPAAESPADSDEQQTKNDPEAAEPAAENAEASPPEAAPESTKEEEEEAKPSFRFDTTCNISGYFLTDIHSYQ